MPSLKDLCEHPAAEERYLKDLRNKQEGKAAFMDDLGWLLLVIGLGWLAVESARRWYRRRVASRLADRLLEDVVKGKDMFRR